MRKSYLSSGKAFFGIKIEHFVTKHIFANALAEYCAYEDADLDIESLNKTEAKKILKRRLFFYGNEGEDEPSKYESSDEDPVEQNYDKAITWIEKNYPYLDTEN